MKKIIIFLFFGVFIWSACDRGLYPSTTEVRQYRMDGQQKLLEDTAIVLLLAPYKKQLEAEMNEVLGEAAIDLNKAKPESSLGNWVADLTHYQCEALSGKAVDFAVANYGGLRISQIPAGPITRGKIYELMPFENMLVILEVNGRVVQQLFDRMADYGGWPISFPVRYEIKEGKAKDITIAGKALDKNRIYRIAVTDFVANGGDRCFFFEGEKREVLGKKFRDVILDYVVQEGAAGSKISARIEGRVMSSQ